MKLNSIPIRLENCSKTYNQKALVLQPTSLTISAGETLVLLGPSGCGKTTTLRLIAGLERPDPGGHIFFGDEDVTEQAIEERRVGMVFQNYALFPNFTVRDNIGYGLKIKKVPARQRKLRVDELLELVHLTEHADKNIAQLSGGQKQRVALARALVNRPRALLLDEPLAALDLKLRQAMQLELKRIQREVGITFVFVTHDQNEALTMSDRLIVMNTGRIEQLGTPREVYEHPATRFVAGFIGTSNLITRRVESMDGSTAILATAGEGESIVVPDAARVGARTGAPLDVTVRPEKISLVAAPTAGMCALRGTIAEVVYLGTATQYGVTISDGTELLVFVQNATDSQDIAERGAQVWLSWRPDHSLALQDSGSTATAAAGTDDADTLLSASVASDSV